MPNWSNNMLTVRGPAEDVLRFKEKARCHSPWLKPEEGSDEDPNPLNFHSLVAIPDDIVQAGHNQAAHTWELEHWGCKWVPARPR